MTSISGISGVSGSFRIQDTSLRGPLPLRNGQDPMTSVAKALSLSIGDLKQQLRDGKSLSDLAERQGVAHDDLIAAIKAGRPGNAPAAALASIPALDDELAEKIASTRGTFTAPPPPPDAPRGDAAGLQDESKLQQLSTLLETDADSLRNSTATEVVMQLQQKGIDLSQLRSILNSGDLVDYTA